MNHVTSNAVQAPSGRRFFSHLSLKALTPYGFLLPFLIIFSVFGVFPLLFSVYLSFHAWNPVEGVAAMNYVGFDNYQVALT
nr:sugar ABC transporter permease [Vibrio anguillarum]